MVTVPAPVTMGSCGTWNGPGWICCDSSRVPFTSTSTVEGTAAVPPSVGSGKVTRSGRMEKSDPIATPPMRSGRVQARPPLMKSPSR